MCRTPKLTLLTRCSFSDYGHLTTLRRARPCVAGPRDRGCLRCDRSSLSTTLSCSSQHIDPPKCPRSGSFLARPLSPSAGTQPIPVSFAPCLRLFCRRTDACVGHANTSLLSPMPVCFCSDSEVLSGQSHEPSIALQRHHTLPWLHGTNGVWCPVLMTAGGDLLDLGDESRDTIKPSCSTPE